MSAFLTHYSLKYTYIIITRVKYIKDSPSSTCLCI